MQDNKELFLEESIETLSNSDIGALELPLSRKAFVFVLLAVFLAGAVIFGRLFFLGELNGNFYKARAEANAGKEVEEPAARGIIYDRFGKPLVENTQTFSVVARVDKALSVAKELEISDEEISSLLTNADIEKSSMIVLARDLDPEKIVRLKSLNLEGVEIINDYKRHYLDGSAFAHVIGYTGLDKNNKIIGKVGLEAFYNDYLKGSDGNTILYRDALGKIVDKKTVNLAVNGNDIYTAIDADFQKYFYDLLTNQLSFLGRSAGVGIALNPKTGEVLSLISLPSFDNNIFGEAGKNQERIKLINSGLKPMFNRAVSGVYTPGSVIKPVVAVAGLKEGVIDTSTKVFSAGFIEIPNPYNPDQPSRFLDWKAHGWVDVYSALARSSNIFFYAVGGGFGDIKGLGIDRLNQYWREFGLGKKTGIDLGAESAGFLPNPDLKEKKSGDIWRIGDTYNVTIGQGDLMVTPLQILSQIASMANGGKFFKPYLLEKIEDTYGKTLMETRPSVLLDNSSLEDYFKEVRKGMEDAVSKPYGTANMLSVLPVKAAGKTGSSQVSNNTKTNAFFIGYMPADDPQIAVLVLIEDAKEGSLNAVPVGKDALEWYYYNRLAESIK